MKEESGPGGFKAWRQKWIDGWFTEAAPMAVLSFLWRRLPRLSTGLGQLAKGFTEEGMPPKESSFFRVAMTSSPSMFKRWSSHVHQPQSSSE